MTALREGLLVDGYGFGPVPVIHERPVSGGVDWTERSMAYQRATMVDRLLGKMASTVYGSRSVTALKREIG